MNEEKAKPGGFAPLNCVGGQNNIILIGEFYIT